MKIILIILLSFGLRLISLNQGLWLDEAINVVFAGKLSLIDFITKYPLADFHPPAYFAILWIWIHFFGMSEIAVRLPSVLLGVGTVYLIYLIGQKIWNTNVGLLAALFLSVSPLHIYYSQEARMYSMAAFAACVSFYSLLRLLEKPMSKKLLLYYGLSVSLVLYSDYVAYLILPIQLLIVLYQKRQLIKLVTLGQILGMVSLLPWALIFPSQLANGRMTAAAVPGWNAVVGGTNLKDVSLIWIKLLVGRISFENKFVYELIVGSLTLLYGIVLYPLVKKFEKSSFFVFSWFGLPIILAFAISFFIPILSYFRLLYIVPAFTLLLAVGLARSSRKWRIAILSLILFLNIVFSAIYLLNPKYQREDWKGAVGFLDSEDSSQSIVLFENNNIPAPFEYYWHHQIKAQAALSKFPASSEVDLVDLEKLLLLKVKVYLVDYLVDVTDPQRLVAKKMQQIGFHQTKIDNFNRVGFIFEYSR